MDEFVLKFRGFQPSDFSREFFAQKLRELSDDCPYGARLQAIVSKREAMFRAVTSLDNFFVRHMFSIDD